MSRLITSGCEIGLETNDVRLGTDGDRENIGGVNPARDTSVFRSGAAAYKFDAGAAGESFIEWNTPGTGATTNRHYFVRGYFRFPDTTPTSEFNLLTGSLSGSTVVAVRLKTDGTLTLSRRVNTAANIGTPSSALVADTWHRIELRWMVATGGGSNSSCELYLDGVLVSTVTGQNFNSTALNRFEAGATTTPGGSNFLIYLDDVALNDDQGSDQNSYPGEGKVVLLKPISDSQVGSWTGGSGGTSNLFDAVDNTPPVGTASESNTTQIESVDTSGDNGTDEYRASLTTYTSAGIGAEDTITLLHPILWHGTDAAVAGVTGSYGGVSNPSWTYDTFSYGDGLSAAVGTWDVNWRPKHGTIQYAPSVTLGTSPVIGLRKTDATAGVASACFMGVYVEYVEGEGEALPGYQRISGPAQLTASAATLYTVPDGCRLELRSVDLNNPSGSLRKVTLSVGSDAAATRVLELLDIDAGASLNLRRGINHTLEAGEVLQGYADSAGVVVATIDGWLEEI